MFPDGSWFVEGISFLQRRGKDILGRDYVSRKDVVHETLDKEGPKGGFKLRNRGVS